LHPEAQHLDFCGLLQGACGRFGEQGGHRPGAALSRLALCLGRERFQARARFGVKLRAGFSPAPIGQGGEVGLDDAGDFDPFGATRLHPVALDRVVPAVGGGNTGGDLLGALVGQGTRIGWHGAGVGLGGGRGLLLLPLLLRGWLRLGPRGALGGGTGLGLGRGESGRRGRGGGISPSPAAHQRQAEGCERKR
jgi:hypothetical protein